jgi:hypothetical protein
MAKNQRKSAPPAGKSENAAGDTPAAAERDYPWTGKAVNNTPIPIYLSEAGVTLSANFYTPANEAEVTYQSADHFAREMANVDAIASVHGFENALILSDLDESTE